MNPSRQTAAAGFSVATAFAISFLSVAGTAAIDSASAAPVRKTESGLTEKLRVARVSFPNGLRLLVCEDHSSPTFAWQTWFRVGSRDEAPGRTGLAHLFEHMMFKGTRNHPEGDFDRILEGAGAEGQNAFTSRDYTAYVQELPATPENLEMIASLEADRMVNLVVDDRSFSTEREVVQNERRLRTENSPEGLMYQEIFGLAFEKHSYRWPVIGYEKDLAGMKAADARDFYLAHYFPGNAVVVVTGDVNTADIIRLVEKHYGSLGSRPIPRNTSPAEPPQKGSRSRQLSLNIQLPKMMAAWRIPSSLDPEMPAISVLGAVLTDGKSSRLQRALVESGVASSVYGYAMDGIDPSLWLLGITLQAGHTTAEAEKIVLAEIARIGREGVTAAELERSRNAMDFGFYSTLSGASGRANFLGESEVTVGGFENSLRLMEKVRKVGSDQVRAAALKWLAPELRNTIFAQPKAPAVADAAQKGGR